MHPDELERLISRRLGRLPAPLAPPGLLPRVMAAVLLEIDKPWYARPWAGWPRGLRVASAAAAVCAAWLLSSAWNRIELAEPALVGTAGLVWEMFLAPNAVYLAVLTGAMGAASVLFCAALSRILREGSPE